MDFRLVVGVVEVEAGVQAEVEDQDSWRILLKVRHSDKVLISDHRARSLGVVVVAWVVEVEVGVKDSWVVAQVVETDNRHSERVEVVGDHHLPVGHLILLVVEPDNRQALHP